MSTTTLPISRARVIGTGLLGTSIALGLREHAVEVDLDDSSPSRLRLAEDYGAGQAVTPATPATPDPDLVVVATPPDVTAAVVSDAVNRFPEAVVMDVASVKNAIVESVADTTGRFVPTHPMAGRERGGPTAARVDLFTGRPWVVCAEDSPASGIVRQLVAALGGFAVSMTPEEHDRAVAVLSHLPQVVSSSVAAELISADAAWLELAGGGVRDVTRIAGSDPELWAQILEGNHAAVADVVQTVADRLSAVAGALREVDAPGSRTTLHETLRAGRDGVSALPGKHGSAERYVTQIVVIDDRPGQLAALLSDVGELGVNLEDMSLEHSPGAPVGFVELAIAPEAAETLRDGLSTKGWRVSGEAQ